MKYTRGKIVFYHVNTPELVYKLYSINQSEIYEYSEYYVTIYSEYISV